LNLLKKIREDEKLKSILSNEPLIADFNNISEEELIKLIYEHTFLLYHGCCTAAMGKVVDERLRVYNINKLRIVDASIMPIITRGNTNAPTVAIAEKAAEMILDDFH